MELWPVAEMLRWRQTTRLGSYLFILYIPCYEILNENFRLLN